MEETEKAVQFEVPEGMKLKIGDRVRVPLFNNGKKRCRCFGSKTNAQVQI